MIIKFKLFENINEGEPQVGDYIIGCPKDVSILLEDKEKLSKIFANNIGKIMFVYNRYKYIPRFNIRYEVKYLDLSPEDEKLVYLLVDDRSNCISIMISEIEYWSKNKEDLEDVLAAKNFNL